jgi:transketolase
VKTNAIGRDPDAAPATVAQLEREALGIRRNILRCITAGTAGHVGGALSAADIVTALYFRVMRHDPSRPDWPGRDRFVLSAGHKCMVLYSALAARGYFPVELLDTYVSLGSKLPGHPDMNKLPGVEASTGALGHGLGIAGGMAMGLRLSGITARVFALMGDGEQAEGSIWEAAAAASHHGLDNLVGIVDSNGLQISGPTSQVMNYEPLHERWKAFGWSVRRIDGHSFPAILEALEGAPFESGKPSLVVADTIKARGLSFAEGKVDYHYWKPAAAELEQARKDLDAIERTLGR